MKKNKKVEPVLKSSPNKTKSTQREVADWENDGGNNLAPVISADKALKRAKEHQAARRTSK